LKKQINYTIAHKQTEMFCNFPGSVVNHTLKLCCSFFSIAPLFIVSKVAECRMLGDERSFCGSDFFAVFAGNYIVFSSRLQERLRVFLGLERRLTLSLTIHAIASLR
jgi:hypothetical protein